VIAALSLPRLDAHLLMARVHAHPLARLKATLTEPNHLRAFGLTSALMFGAFCVVPYLSPFLVSNAKIDEDKLAVVYIVGGLLTLVGSPIAGKLADRYGKLRMYRILAPLLAIMFIVATNLPAVSLPVAATVMGLLMLFNAGRMVPAMAMVTSSVAPQQRAGFLGANSAVQHVAAGIGSSVGGLILMREGFLGYDANYHEVSAGIGGSVGGFVLSSAYDGIMVNYPLVGLLGVAVTLVTLWLAGRLRVVTAEHPTTTGEALAAAAQGNVDADEPITVAEL
jgi:predicted MFS family arabinose efflux permease